MDDQRYWIKKADEAKDEQLERLRKAAENWRTGLGGLTALLAVLGTLKGRDAIQALSSSGRVWAGVLLGLGFLTLLTGMLVAMRAAFGLPMGQEYLTVPAVRARTLELYRTIPTRIKASRILFVAGVGCVALAVALSWYDPGPPTKPLIALEIRGESQAICGMLEGTSDGLLTLVLVDVVGQEQTRAIPLSEVAELNVVAKCEASPGWDYQS